MLAQGQESHCFLGFGYPGCGLRKCVVVTAVFTHPHLDLAFGMLGASEREGDSVRRLMGPRAYTRI